MKTRLLFSAVGIPILLILLIVLPDWGTLIFCAVLAAIAAHEMICAVGDGGRFPIYGAIFGAAAVVFIYFFGLSRMTAALAGVMILIGFLDLIITRGGKRASDFMDVLSLIFSAALLPLLFSSLLGLRRAEFGRIYVLMPLFAAFMSDTGAYFAGMYLGKHKLAPLVSPNKTVEGSIGGLVGGVVGMYIFGLILLLFAKTPFDPAKLAVYGVIGSFLGQVGDLSFSAVKREYDIKDYGKIFPGHGGVLDRFDSVLFVAPAFYLILGVWPL